LRRAFVGLRFPAGHDPQAGAALELGGRHVGHLTSAGCSGVLGHVVALGWVDLDDGATPERVRAGGVEGEVVPLPFYDPEGARVRA
jgi:sarcosine oxidase subunit alpha